MSVVLSVLPLVQQGDACSRSVRFSRDDIAAFARLSGDSNPLHHDHQAAQRARHGEIIASGEQSAAVLIGHIPDEALASGIALQAAWAALFFIVARVLYQLGLQRYSAFGG